MGFYFYHDKYINRYVITVFLFAGGLMFLTESFLVWIPAVFSLTLFSYLFYRGMDNNKLVKEYKECMVDCRASDGYEKMKAISNGLRNAKNKDQKKKKMALNTYIIACCESLGKWDEVEALLEEIDDQILSELNEFEVCVINYHRVRLYLNTGDLDKARIALENIFEWLGNNSGRKYEDIRDLYLIQKLRYNIRMRDYPNEWVMLDLLIQKREPGLNKVMAIFVKGECMYYQNMYEEALKIFEEVESCGGDSIWVEEAMDYIEKIRG